MISTCVLYSHHIYQSLKLGNRLGRYETQNRIVYGTRVPRGLSPLPAWASSPRRLIYRGGSLDPRHHRHTPVGARRSTAPQSTSPTSYMMALPRLAAIPVAIAGEETEGVMRYKRVKSARHSALERARQPDLLNASRTMTAFLGYREAVRVPRNSTFDHTGTQQISSRTTRGS